MLESRMYFKSHEFSFHMNQDIVRTRPISPIRLYRTACKAAVLASERPNHHPIRRKDIIPTPSQPIKSCIRLLAETRIIIVIRKIRRYLMKRFKLGSACIYQVENSIMDQVTYRATGMKRREYRSSLKLIMRLVGWIEIQCQLVIVDS